MPRYKQAGTLPHEEQISTAVAVKQCRIDQTNTYINDKQWPGKAAMVRLGDAEKMQYNDSLDYLDELEEVNTSSAPDIERPTQPESSAR